MMNNYERQIYEQYAKRERDAGFTPKPPNEWLDEFRGMSGDPGITPQDYTPNWWSLFINMFKRKNN